MALANEATTTQLTKLIDEAKSYYHLEKRCLGLHGAETLTVLLSRITLWVIVLLIGFLVLLFGSQALAFWIGSITGNLIIGVCSVAAFLLLICLVIYIKRQAWIEEPIARFMAQLFVPDDDDEQEKGGVQ
ncbi:MAG: hypothetical protein J5486_05540 [Bacteroidaceae bacterium]|nr:hypothetical protein [Bacteroidaceae bacterium]